MSHGNLPNGTNGNHGPAGAAPTTLEVRPIVAPANDTGLAVAANDTTLALAAGDTTLALAASDAGGDAVVDVGAAWLGLPRTYWTLWTGMLLNRLGGSIFFLLGLYLTRERGLSTELAGLVISLYAVGGLVAGPVGGALADRVGRRATLVVGTACGGTLMLALGLARSVATIAVLAPLVGFCSSACVAPLQAAVADVVPPARRARAYGVLYWAANLGFAVASLLGGALAERHFTLLFVLDALTTAAYGAIVYLGVPETRPASALDGEARRAARLFAPLHDAPFVRFVLVQALLLVAFAQVITALSLDMRAHGLPLGSIGWLMGLNGLYIVAAQPLALRFLRGRSHVEWLVAGCLLTGLGLGATALAGGPLVYALSAVVWTLGEIGFSTAAPALVAELAPVAQRGAYQGTYHLAWGTASVLAPTLGTFVLARFGSRALWLGCLAVCFTAAALHARVTARARR
ncbi:MAG TPA: MFS transporter [Polyangia bacterium]|nr:MFS transporter [Polyangia bacterium]